MSFRHKLLACFVGLLFVVLGASLATMERLETKRAERDLVAELEMTRGLFNDLLAQRDRELAASLKLLSGDFAFKQAIATADPGTIASVAGNHRARMGADVLLVTDGDGAPLADTRGKGRGKKGVPVVEKALDERSASGLYVLDGAPYQLAAVTINAPDVIGVVAAGFKIDDRLAESLKRTTRSEVTFLASGAAAGSTLPQDARADIAKAAGELGAAPRIIRVGGERFLATGSEGGGPVGAVVMRSWDKAIEPLRALQRRVLWIGVIGLAATAFLGSLIAAGITASLAKLARAAGEISRGRYDVTVDIPSKDEIGDLGRAFTSMAHGLLEREKIRSILNRTVSKEIAESLVAQGKIELGGEEREVTVLFSDIRSFTTISESLPPKELVSQLNAYFTAVARAIESEKGVIDKYIGDAVMALFGAPVSTKDDPANALRAALAMSKAVDALNAEREKAGLPPMKTGIGVNTGNVVAGTLGSEERWSYTVIGDAVNLASRLESSTKDLGARIVVSRRTKELAGPGFSFRPLGSVTVKGKTEAVEVFELLG